MFSTPRSGHGLLTATGLAMLLVSGCGGSDTTGTTSPDPTPTPPATSTSQTPSAPASTPAPSAPATTPTVATADVTVDITVKRGKVDPSGKSIKVKAGQKVQLNATTDAADTIHVHGYDKELPMTPGKTTSLTFVADNLGTFEVETHESGKLVAKLIVS